MHAGQFSNLYGITQGGRHERPSNVWYPSYRYASLRSHLHAIKDDLDAEEIFYLTTCNRILFLVIRDQELEDSDLEVLFPEVQERSCIKSYNGEQALLHLFQVASSIHSLVVGEREILKQIKDAYDQQSSWKLTGDHIRLAIQQTIRTAKKVYANTKIGDRPVSVVSLAVQKMLVNFDLNPQSHFLIVGAGSTIQLILKHLTKKGFRNFSLFNRSVTKAKRVANDQGLSGQVGSLTDLESYKGEWDCMIACTGSTQPLISDQLADRLSQGDIRSKVWIDLGIPADVPETVRNQGDDCFVGLQSLKELAGENMRLRQDEVIHAAEILADAVDAFRQLVYRRRIEKAFRAIPDEIKTIRKKAEAEVFKKELAALDSDTRAIIAKMMSYMEKKCISVPMKAAKEAAF